LTLRHEELNRGYSTATSTNVAYRLGLIERCGLLAGRWLDCGAAEGGFASALPRYGASDVVAIDIEHPRVVEGSTRCDEPTVVFSCAASEALPLRDESFDGVLLNEVLEHVADEKATLREIRRVLRPGGHLALMSPNRWFPFEGHGLALRDRSLNWPVPLVPWLPQRWFRHSLRARNYWPSELVALVEEAGFEVRHSQSVFPMFDRFRWLPAPLIRFIQRSPETLGRVPFVRRMGVSTLVIATRGR
jgi:2-polyprenyl-3-methyl-5-hydroxy-6-metoxy-1,4-benzoquinol methylase